MTIPSDRVRALGSGRLRPSNAFVLYWMTAHRRLAWNFALDRAVALAGELGRPLVIFEPIRAGYEWASERHHGWILDGMREHAASLAGGPARYYPYIEPAAGEGRGLLSALSEHAAVVVADDHPGFFQPRMLEAAGRKVDCRLEAVDSCGLLPVSAPGRTFTAAYHFRRHLQKTLAPRLVEMPSDDPLAELAPVGDDPIPGWILERWPEAPASLLAGGAGLSGLPIDHAVGRTERVGGTASGRRALESFVADGLPRYAERNHPDSGAASGLSPWLHFGHISAHEVFMAIASAEGWSPLRISEQVDGKRTGWWGLSASAEAFLDQLVTWRELGFVYCREVPEYANYDSLPEWARGTLADHARDPREYLYSLDEFAGAETHDELWNAAQRQLAGEGIIHNYLRMLWGKKILEWTRDPREALHVMTELNNRYALDGRDPNSYSGIFWTLGRFDRGWPERAVYGKVRSMSSVSTRRKVRVAEYLERWGR